MGGGDFAAGKLIDGVMHEPIGADNFAQFQADLEDRFGKLSLFQPPDFGPSTADLSGLPPLLASLLAWKDGGIVITQFTIVSSADIVPAAAMGGPFTIGHDLDGGELVLDPATSSLSSGGLLLGDFGQWLGTFRNQLIAGTLEWAEGEWVEVQK